MSRLPWVKKRTDGPEILDVGETAHELFLLDQAAVVVYVVAILIVVLGIDVDVLTIK